MNESGTFEASWRACRNWHRPPISKSRAAPPARIPIALLMILAFTAFAACTPSYAHAAEEQIVHVCYQWIADGTGMVEDFEAFDVVATQDGNVMRAPAMPDALPLGDAGEWRVMKNFAGGTACGEQDITSEAAYDEESGTITLPSRRSGEDISVVFTLPWSHEIHASHGHFNKTAVATDGKGALRAAEAGELAAAGIRDLSTGTVYPLSITSGANGLESDPKVYGADSNVGSAGSVMGYPEFDGRYMFYVAFSAQNCTLFEELGQVPGRQGNGGTIYGSSGTPYDYSWAADFKWCNAHCVENVFNGAGMPVPLEGAGSWVRIDSIEGSVVSCSFRIECNNPNGTNAQDIMGTFELVAPKGSISFEKASANDGVSSSNACYSLAGAEYGVFSTQEGAESNNESDMIASYVTDENGAWESGDDYDPATYYIRELRAPMGFALSDEVIPVNVDAGAVCPATASDTPLACPGMQARKIDAATKKGSPQGDASLEGAELTFCYYDGYYSQASLPEAATRAWVMKTGPDGCASLQDGESMQVSGDAFYRDDSGEVRLPLGTVTVIETRAPKGYLLGTPKLFIAHIVASPTADAAVIEPLNYSGDETSDANAPIIEEKPETGLGEIAKVDSSSMSAAPQGDATLAGAVFEVLNMSENAVAVNGAEYHPGDIVMELTTGADGTASTGRVLPYGTYLIREKQAPEGYLIDDAWAKTLIIDHDGQAETAVAPNDVKRGALTLVKFSRHLERTGPAGDASLAGATFEIVNDSDHPVVVAGVTYAKGDVVKTLVTDDDGIAETEDRALPYGTYLVRETKTTEAGYLFDPISKLWKASICIDADGMRAILSSKAEGPSNDEMRGNIALIKVDADTGKRMPQGDASLAGARYDIINRSTASVASPQTSEEVMPGSVVCTIVTDETGYAATDNAAVNGWTMPGDFNGKALAYGTYEVIEQSPAGGYLLNTSFSATVEERSDGQVATIETTDPVERGRLVVGKTSRELAAYLEQGAASLSGWSFEVVNRSDNPVVVDGAEHMPGEVVQTLTVDWSEGACIADTGERCLPFGTYEVREIQTMRPQDNGYLLDETSLAWSKTFVINQDGQTVDFSGEQDACANQVARGDLSLAKAESPSMERLAGVPFKITSATTGEWHVLVTDENGMASTESGFCPHTASTNANDGTIDENGGVDEAKLDCEAGIWFSGRGDVSIPADDAKGALPFDTYRIEELPVSANAGLNLVSFDVTVRRNESTIELGTVSDTKDVQPQISTFLEGEGAGKLVQAEELVELVDTVTYANLDTQATYWLEGGIYLIEDGVPIMQLASSSIEFSPSTTHGTIHVPFTGIDASGAVGKNLVCFEKLLDAEGNTLAVHEDPLDEGQTVGIVGIGTELTDTATRSHTATLDGTGAFELVDAVSYTGLMPTRVYTVTGSLMDKETGTPILDAHGRAVSATTSFTPDASDGTVNLTFAFAASGLEGRSIVAFETLSHRGTEYAVHADLEDEGQTVAIPRVATSLTDADTGWHVIPCSGSVTIVDDVAYSNLVPGRQYTAIARLHDRSTGTPIMLVDGDDGASPSGTPPESHVEFVPDNPDGTVSVRIEIDASQLPQATVCTERILDSSGRIAAVHDDLEDDGQTVTKADASTTLVDAENGTHLAIEAGSYHFVDSVKYRGLEVGRTYTVKGTLHFKDTGEAVTNESGTAIEAQREFTCEKADDLVQVPFDFECPALAGKAVVAFEAIEAGGREYACHADIEDDEQAVRIPAIGTALVDASNGGHMSMASGSYRLVDAIAFDGLEPGCAYVAEGELIDADTGKPVKDDNGRGATARTEFTPSSPSGSAMVLFDFDSADIGDAVVAFERVYAQGELIASHEDIAAETQTVRIPRISTTALDASSDTHEADAAEGAAIIDRVSYSGLEAGRTYRIQGTLMDKAASCPILGPDGAITAECDFEASEPSGTETVTFDLSQSDIADKTLVAFEELYLVEDDETETLVARHADIEDEDQSVRYRPPSADDVPKQIDTPKQNGMPIWSNTFDKTGYWLLQQWPIAVLAAGAALAAGLVMMGRRPSWHGRGARRARHVQRR